MKKMRCFSSRSFWYTNSWDYPLLFAIAALDLMVFRTRIPAQCERNFIRARVLRWERRGPGGGVVILLQE